MKRRKYLQPRDIASVNPYVMMLMELPSAEMRKSKTHKLKSQQKNKRRSYPIGSGHKISAVINRRSSEIDGNKHEQDNKAKK